jgi:glutamine synthetase adenylyltransferase
MAVLSASQRSGEPDSGSFMDELRQRMQAVAAIYDRIIHHEQQPRSGPNAPEAGANSFNRGFAHVLERLAEDAPSIAALARRDDLHATTRRHVERWLSAAAATPERYARVIAAPLAAEKALLVLEASEYVADVLARFPHDVVVFGGVEQDPGAAPCRPGYLFPEQERGEALSRLRERFRQRMLACAAKDIFESPAVYSSLANTTAAADEAIRSAVAIAGGRADFAVLALGRLGTCEFDLLSDADLLFVRSERLGAEPAAAIAERVIQALAAYTSEGMVFPVDARLRPHGGEGELVVTAKQLRNYLLDEAQPWEALTFTKLRGVAGSEALREQALAAAAEGMKRFAADAGLARHVREMRTRVEAAGQADFKTGYGGIYDIDFLASYLLVRACRPVAANIHDRLNWLCQHGALPPPDASDLSRSAELLRSVEHAVRLVTGRMRETLPASQHSCLVIGRLLSARLSRKAAVGLELELEQARGSVRGCFDRMLQ